MKDMSRQRRRRILGVLVLVGAMATYFVAISVCQTRSARQFAQEAPDSGAYWDATYFGLSDRGAKAWSRYSDNAERFDELEHVLVASGDKESIEFCRLSLGEYLERHLQYQRMPEEDAQLDPHLRELIDSSRTGGDDESGGYLYCPKLLTPMEGKNMAPKNGNGGRDRHGHKGSRVDTIGAVTNTLEGERVHGRGLKHKVTALPATDVRR
jgi:hypothetical protein